MTRISHYRSDWPVLVCLRVRTFLNAGLSDLKTRRMWVMGGQSESHR